MSKEHFKSFVRKHPELITHINNNSMTWQKFYDMYDLYGEENKIWDNYFNNTITTTQPSKIDSMKELLNMIRNVDLNSVQKGISGIEKAIGLIKDLSTGNSSSSTDNYEPRPMYKYFED